MHRHTNKIHLFSYHPGGTLTFSITYYPIPILSPTSVYPPTLDVSVKGKWSHPHCLWLLASLRGWHGVLWARWPLTFLLAQKRSCFLCMKLMRGQTAQKYILKYVVCHMTSSEQLLLKGLDSFVVPAPLFALVSSPPVALAFPNFAFVDNCQLGFRVTW